MPTRTIIAQHDGTTLEIPTSDTAKLSPEMFRRDEWLFITGLDGSSWAVHTKTISSVTIKRDAPES